VSRWSSQENAGREAGREIGGAAEVSPAQTEIQRQPRQDLPVILAVECKFVGSISTVINRKTAGERIKRRPCLENRVGCWPCIQDLVSYVSEETIGHKFFSTLKEENPVFLCLEGGSVPDPSVLASDLV